MKLPVIEVQYTAVSVEGGQFVEGETYKGLRIANAPVSGTYWVYPSHETAVINGCIMIKDGKQVVVLNSHLWDKGRYLVGSSTPAVNKSLARAEQLASCTGGYTQNNQSMTSWKGLFQSTEPDDKGRLKVYPFDYRSDPTYVYVGVK